MQIRSRNFMFGTMLMLAGGCGVQEAADTFAQGEQPEAGREAAGVAVPRAASAVADGAGLLGRDWERTSHAVRVLRSLPEDGARADGALSPQQLVPRALSDAAWRSRDGQRYEALFIGEDGTAYGRLGSAPSMTSPGAENHYGAYDPRGGTGAEATEPEGGRPRVGSASGDGAPVMGVILGGTLDSDRRSRYGTVAQLETYPLRTVGALSGNGNTQAGGCTGTMVGPRHVLTAAHCVMNAAGDIATSGWFNPGQTNTVVTNGGNSRRWSGVMLRDYRVHRKFDYALLYLDDRADNAALGWMGIAFWSSTSSYSGKVGYNKGYPCGPNMTCGGIANQQCKASPRADKRCDGWMYGDSATLHADAATSDDRLEYNLDTSDGHSGSAIYTYLGDAPAVMAVHAGPDGSYNAGARFRTSMYNDICGWIAAVPSAHGTHPLCH